MAKAVTALNVPNKTQYFRPSDDQWILTQKAFKASQALSDGGAVGIEISGNTTTGYLTVYTPENASGADFVGILAEPIATTDTDYATAGKMKGVRVPRTSSAKCFFTVAAGTFTAVDVGKTVEVYTGSLGLAVDTAGKGARITDYISATRGKCVFCMPNTETA